jgi:hypothetical protein
MSWSLPIVLTLIWIVIIQQTAPCRAFLDSQQNCPGINNIPTCTELNLTLGLSCVLGKPIENSKVVPDDLAGTTPLFGYSISMDDEGLTTVITAKFNGDLQEGAAWVYLRDAVTSKWANIAKITTLGSRFFGFDAAISGDGNTIALATQLVAKSGHFICTFHRVLGGTSWPTDGCMALKDELSDVKLSQDGTLLVTGGANGMSSVYTRSGNLASGFLWLYMANLTIPLKLDEAADASTLAISANGDRIVVGYPKSGAFVFSRSGATWSPFHILDTGDSNFYTTVQMNSNGDTVAVCRNDDNVPGSCYMFIFEQSTNSWKLAPSILKTTELREGAPLFGARSFAMSGDASLLLMSGNGDIAPDTTIMGSAFLFGRTDPIAWSAFGKFSTPTNVLAGFSGDMAISRNGKHLAIAADGDNVGKGSVFFYLIL